MINIREATAVRSSRLRPSGCSPLSFIRTSTSAAARTCRSSCSMLEKDGPAAPNKGLYIFWHAVRLLVFLYKNALSTVRSVSAIGT